MVLGSVNDSLSAACCHMVMHFDPVKYLATDTKTLHKLGVIGDLMF